MKNMNLWGTGVGTNKEKRSPMWVARVGRQRPKHKHTKKQTDGAYKPNTITMAPSWGLSTPRAPKELFPKIQKNIIWSRNKCFPYGFAPCFA